MAPSLIRHDKVRSVVNVVLLPAGPQGDGMLQLASRWATAGLIDPALWVRAADVHEHHLMPARIDAVAIGLADGSTPELRVVPLFEALGREPADEIVLSGLRWPLGSVSDIAVSKDAARRTLEMLEASIPLAIDGRTATTIRSINVVASPTYLSSEAVEDLLSMGWQDNIVVSPEDRQRPTGLDRFVDADDEEVWIGFATASLSTLAGLWTGHVGSPIDSTPGSEAAGELPSVRVARSFARVVVTDDYTEDLARAAALALAGPTLPETNGGVPVLSAPEAEMKIAEATQQLLDADSAALRYAPPAPRPEPIKRPIALFHSLARFLRFCWDKVIVLPVWAWDWVADKIGKGATRSFYGAEADMLVDARRDLGLEDSPYALIEINEAMAEASARMHSELVNPRYRGARIPTVDVWQNLERTVFSLVDGLDATEGGSGHNPGPVVPDVSMVIPAPTDEWVLPGDVAQQLSGTATHQRRVSWTNLSAAHELSDYLAERAQELQQRLQEMQARAAASQSDLIGADRELVEAKESLEDLEADLGEAEEALSLMADTVLLDEYIGNSEDADTDTEVEVEAEEAEPASATTAGGESPASEPVDPTVSTGGPAPKATTNRKRTR